MKKIIFPLFTILFFVSCQQVIDINLNSVSPKLVVEDNISTKPGPYLVKLTRTTNFFGDTTPAFETGAQVIINDNSGHRDTLHELYPGKYFTTSLTGNINETYTLSVNTQGQNYLAVAPMTDTLTIDSISYALRTSTHNGNSYSVTFSFTDPPQLGNYYGFRVYQNGLLVKDIADNKLFSDALFNGGAVHQRISGSSMNWLQNDTIKVELVCFNKTAYDFYNTLQKTMQSGSPFSSPPANPVNNLNNGALGFFGVDAVTSKSIVLL